MRSMATVKAIEAIEAIEGADTICSYVVGGWRIVDKIEKFHIGEKVIMCEIDSWMPDSLAPFLSNGKSVKEFNGVKGQRLKTIRLRGVISQGLILPVSVLNTTEVTIKEGLDVSDLLGIVKYEPPVHANLQGVAKGNFPSCCPKTDQERIQNVKVSDILKHKAYEVTEKLDGSSATYICDGYDIHVCSRNLSLKYQEDNLFCKAEKKYNIIPKLMEYCRENNRSLAIQGELIASTIQGNKYKLEQNTFEFYVFDIYDINTASYLDSKSRQELCSKLNLSHVPVLAQLNLEEYLCNALEFGTIQTSDDIRRELLKFADGYSEINEHTLREGLVFKSLDDPNFSFKAVSDEWLLAYKE